jgi:tRNA pseudouridine13 synthase
VRKTSLRVLKQVRHKRKLQRGAHSANGFTLRLTATGGRHRRHRRAPEQLKQHGIPNYFGTQRFGHGGGNVHDALDWAARKALPEQRNVRSRLLSTGRSYLFNQVLAARVADGSWQRAQVGDLLAFTDSRSFFPAGEAECSRPAPGDSRSAPDRPDVGRGRLACWRATALLEHAVGARQPALCQWLAQAGMITNGAFCGSHWRFDVALSRA